MFPEPYNVYVVYEFSGRGRDRCEGPGRDKCNARKYPNHSADVFPNSSESEKKPLTFLSDERQHKTRNVFNDGIVELRVTPKRSSHLPHTEPAPGCITRSAEL